MVRAGSPSYSIHAWRHSLAECIKTRTEEFSDNKSTGVKNTSLLFLSQPCRDSVCKRKVIWKKNKKNPKHVPVLCSVDQTFELGVR